MSENLVMEINSQRYVGWADDSFVSPSGSFEVNQSEYWQPVKVVHNILNRSI